jgi:integrase
MRHLLPAFGPLPLPEITRQRIRSQVSVWLGPTGKVRGMGALRRGSVRLIVATLRLILSAAVEDGILAANPALRLGRLLRPTDPGTAVEERPDPFTAQEIETLLGAAAREMPEWHALILTLARTGLRIGEGLALQWDDIGSDRLMVRRTYTRGRLGSPKGNRGPAGGHDPPDRQGTPGAPITPRGGGSSRGPAVVAVGVPWVGREAHR